MDLGNLGFWGFGVTTTTLVSCMQPPISFQPRTTGPAPMLVSTTSTQRALAKLSTIRLSTAAPANQASSAVLASPCPTRTSPKCRTRHTKPSRKTTRSASSAD